MSIADWFRTKKAIIHELERTRQEMFEARANLAKAKAEIIQVRKDWGDTIDGLGRLSLENADLRQEMESMAKKVKPH